MRARPAWVRAAAPLTALAAAAALGGCGENGSYANQPRPPAPIVLTASITPRGVTVSPTHFGAGPINLVVANETDTSQRLSISAVANGQTGEAQEQTGPISPHDTASLQASLDQGRYVIATSSQGTKPARIVVGPERPSAQNQLLQP